MEFLFTWIMSHLLVGLFLGVGTETYFQKMKRVRKWLFRFGGESPFSWGQKRRWLFWYFGALFAELIVKLSLSFFFGIVPSLDFLLSPIQAFLLTTGLWISDRAVMIFEPESRWKEENVANPTEKEGQKSEEKSWIREKITQTVEAADAGAEVLKEKEFTLKEEQEWLKKRHEDFTKGR